MSTPAASFFYVIKLIAPDGTRGWLIDRGPDKPWEISIGGIHIHVTQFATEKAATDFIRARRLERKGVKAYVRTNQDIMAEAAMGLVPNAFVADKRMYYLQNAAGQKLMFDSANKEYFFSHTEAGYCIWPTEAEAKQNADVLNKQYPDWGVTVEYIDPKQK